MSDIREPYIDEQPNGVKRDMRPISGDYFSHPNGRSYYLFDCPFCGSEVKAYAWSLAGGGKKCCCGAMFSRWGYAWKVVK